MYLSAYIYPFIKSIHLYWDISRTQQKRKKKEIITKISTIHHSILFHMYVHVSYIHKLHTFVPFPSFPFPSLLLFFKKKKPTPPHSYTYTQSHWAGRLLTQKNTSRWTVINHAMWLTMAISQTASCLPNSTLVILVFNIKIFALIVVATRNQTFFFFFFFLKS